MTDSPQTHTLDVPGVAITYDVHGDPADATSERPALMMVGSPMGAAGFATLELRHHLLHRPAGDELRDGKRDEQNSQQRGNHEQQALENVRPHKVLPRSLSGLRPTDS